MAKIDYQRIASSLICYGFSCVTREMCLFVLGEVIKNPVVLKNNWSDDQRLNFNMFDYVDFDGFSYNLRRGYSLDTVVDVMDGSISIRSLLCPDDYLFGLYDQLNLKVVYSKFLAGSDEMPDKGGNKLRRVQQSKKYE